MNYTAPVLLTCLGSHPFHQDGNPISLTPRRTAMSPTAPIQLASTMVTNDPIPQ